MPASLRAAVTRPSLRYRVALAVVSAVIVAVPTVYLALVALAASGVYQFGFRAAWLLAFGFFGPAIYAGVVIGGALATVLALAPLLRRTRADSAVTRSFTLTRDDEPALAAFLDDLCALANAPRPERIEVDLSSNASARVEGPILGRGRFVVSFGLPLAAVLDAPAFAAVLVHELAHCRQGVGLRLHRMAGQVIAWLARAMEAQDAWLERCQGYMRAAGPAVDIIVGALALWLAVWRAVLGKLFAGALRANMWLSRLGEFEADRISALVAGRDVASRALRHIRSIPAAMHVVNRELSGSAVTTWPDDLVECTRIGVAWLGPAEWRRIDEAAASEQPGPFDSHPTVPARTARLAEVETPGVLHPSGPAAALFRDFGALGRAYAARMWEDAPPELKTRTLVPAATFMREVVADTRHRVAVELFLGCTAGLGIEAIPEQRGASAHLDPALARLEAARPIGHHTMARADAAFTQHARLVAAREAAAVGLNFDGETFGLDSATLVEAVTLDEAIERSLAVNEAEFEAIRAEVAPLRSAATGALAAALARLDATGTDAAAAEALVRAVNLFARHHAALFDGAVRLAGLDSLVKGAPPEEAELQERVRLRLLDQACGFLAPVLQDAHALELAVAGQGALDAQRALPKTGADAVVDIHEVVLRLQRLQNACFAGLLHLLGLVSPEAVAACLAAVPDPAPLAAPDSASASGTSRSASLARRLHAVVRPIGTLLLAGVNIFTFGMWTMRGANAFDADRMDLLDAGVAFRPLVVNGEWWRIVTAPFANDCAVHLLATLASLAAAGPIVERLFGSSGVVACYAVIGSLSALAGVLLSETGVFCTATAAVTGLAVLFLLATLRVAQSAHVDPPGTDQLAGPRVRAGSALFFVPFIALFSTGSPTDLLPPLVAAGLGALLGVATIADARTATPGNGRVALVVCAAALCLTWGLRTLGEQVDVRAEGLAFLATEERALHDFEAATGGTGDATAALSVVKRILEAGDTAYSRATARRTADAADFRARDRRDRYGRPVDLRAWLAARDAVALDDANIEYLRTRSVAWATRLNLASSGRFVALAEHEQADAQVRRAFRWVLVRPG